MIQTKIPKAWQLVNEDFLCQIFKIKRVNLCSLIFFTIGVIELLKMAKGIKGQHYRLHWK